MAVNPSTCATEIVIFPSTWGAVGGAKRCALNMYLSANSHRSHRDDAVTWAVTQYSLPMHPEGGSTCVPAD